MRTPVLGLLVALAGLLPGCGTVDRDRLMEHRRRDAAEFDRRVSQTKVHITPSPVFNDYRR